MNGIPRAITRLGLDLSEGFDECRDRVYARHAEGIISARQYQVTLNALRAYFGVRTEGKMSRIPSNGRYSMDRETLDILARKIERLQGAINSKASEVLSYVPQSLLEKATVEMGKIDIQIHPYCDRDGFMDADDAEVVANFTTTVKYSRRCGVRV